MAKKIEPLSNVRYFWEHVEEGYPDKIRLAMSDGNVVTYRLEVPQPKPVIFKKIDFSKVPEVKYKILDEWAVYNDKPIQLRHHHLFIGGKYIPKHGKTGSAATLTGQSENFSC